MDYPTEPDYDRIESEHGSSTYDRTVNEPEYTPSQTHDNYGTLYWGLILGGIIIIVGMISIIWNVIAYFRSKI